jgi:hexosaminidase
MHKMNVLHLHLVDDQGWRILKVPEINRNGEVNQEDAWNARAANSLTDKGSYGGFKPRRIKRL